MTREDIDNIISIICPNDEDFEKPIISPACLKNELEALALEQEPYEDSIVEWKKDFKGYINSLLMPRDDYNGIMEYIDELPVTPQYTEAEIQKMQELEQVEIQKAYELGKAEQQKMGRWIRELIRNEKGGCIGAKMICSECGNDNKHDEYMSYCPNCGKKMQKKM